MTVSCIFCKYVIKKCVGRMHLLAIIWYFIFYTMIYMRRYAFYERIVPEIKTTLFYSITST